MTSVREARLQRNGAEAIAALRPINAAEEAFAAGCGGARYAQALDDLAKPPPGSRQAFITSDLSHNGIVVAGYVVMVRADAGASIVTPTSKVCNGAAAHAVSGYFATAVPS